MVSVPTFRDPNALAGDNGIDLFSGAVANPLPELKSGILIFYDTDVEDLDFSNPEIGLALGARFGGDARRWSADPQFRTHPQFPAPSVFWDWEKLDLGLRLGLVDGLLDLTLEWNDNTFVRAGRDESADEFLATVRWEMDRAR